MKMNLQDLASELTVKFEWKKFTFGTTVGSDDWACRYLMSCILVGGSLEASTLRAATQIFDKFSDLYLLEHADQLELEKMISSNGVRFHGPKATYLKKVAGILRARYNGRVPDNRADLEQLPGVARHVANVILATVYGKNEFAVDIHVRRILSRFGFHGSDQVLENLVRESVNSELLGHFSRSFVDFGQTICASTPTCEECFLSSKCPSKAEATQQRPILSNGETYAVAVKIDGDIIRVTYTKEGADTGATVYGKEL
jgi:endonuclease III